ncbi:hypothetical protein [Salinispora arenicola]|uniref:hypothetical protein n=1 Tax=Salinispora arenicola TaxID=168697 RepID=UPI0027DBCCA5|nr:hypothetical protein [Salinispora arenicola]
MADVRGLTATPGSGMAPGVGLREVDHFAVCVEPGRLDRTVEYYLRALDFDLILTERSSPVTRPCASRSYRASRGP